MLTFFLFYVYFKNTASQKLNTLHTLFPFFERQRTNTGDHVHLGPGVTATRQHDPAFPYTSCPPVDFILLSHLHDDHFDSLVAKKLRRDIPIVSTTAAQDALVTPSTDGTRGFTNVIGLDTGTWSASQSRCCPQAGRTSISQSRPCRASTPSA
jgi:hypothetical protein